MRKLTLALCLLGGITIVTKGPVEVLVIDRVERPTED